MLQDLSRSYEVTLNTVTEGILGIDAENVAVMVFADLTARKAAEEELRQSNGRLREALQALAATQQRLFQAEKMAAIGRLAAGVAHEISTPLTFVACNLRSMEIYAGELLRAAEENASEGRSDAKNDGDNGLDLAFLRQDIPALFAESENGISRIAGIVQHLRTFSQIDVDQKWGPADLNAGLDSALKLIAHEIGAGVAILSEMKDLPRIECQAGQINQVFFNLLSNAIQAVGDNGKIWLSSGTAGNTVWIEVADNGCGVAPEHLEQLFDPFFTTRAIGQGMGLGLSDAYGIIRRHGGKLSVANRAGGGTVFRIELFASPESGADTPS